MFKFDAQFFKEHQKGLLFIANRWYLRWLLGLNRLPKTIKGIVWNKITPSSLTAVIGLEYSKKGKLKNIKQQSYIFTRPRFAEALVYNLSPFCYFQNFRLNKMVWRFSPVGLIGCLLVALYPKSIGGFCFFGTTDNIYAPAGDGSIRKSDSTWKGARDATTGTVQATNTAQYLIVGKNGSTYEVYPLWFMFDTSGIASDVTISGATLNISKNNDNSGTANLVLMQSSQAVWNNLASGDFNDRGLGAGEGMTRATYGTGAGYLNLSLNATGIGWIAKSGETKPDTASATGKTQFCVTLANDYDNSEPTAYNYTQIRMSEYTGTDNDPYLAVTYSATATDTFIPKTIFI
jgi:hypothetical protein